MGKGFPARILAIVAVRFSHQALLLAKDRPDAIIAAAFLWACRTRSPLSNTRSR